MKVYNIYWDEWFPIYNIGSIGPNMIYEIEKSDKYFTKGKYVNFITDNQGINIPIPETEMLIRSNDIRISLPIYPAVTLGGGIALFTELMYKGFYLYPAELIRCMDDKGLDYDKMYIMNEAIMKIEPDRKDYFRYWYCKIVKAGNFRMDNIHKYCEFKDE